MPQDKDQQDLVRVFKASTWFNFKDVLIFFTICFFCLFFASLRPDNLWFVVILCGIGLIIGFPPFVMSLRQLIKPLPVLIVTKTHFVILYRLFKWRKNKRITYRSIAAISVTVKKFWTVERGIDRYVRMLNLESVGAGNKYLHQFEEGEFDEPINKVGLELAQLLGVPFKPLADNSRVKYQYFPLIFSVLMLGFIILLLALADYLLKYVD